MEDQKNECEQVVKALECCRHNEEEDTCKYCKECPAGTWELAEEEEELNCIQSMYVRAAALINRQKDEIADLQEQYAEFAKRQLPSYYQACSEEEAINIGREYGKTEVAREIFEEIEKYSELAFKKGYYHTQLLCIGCAVFDGLKKKYTEVDK